MMSRDLWLEADGEKLRATIDAPGMDGVPTVLGLHGAGASNRQRMQYLADALAGAGVGMARFDFSGHGDSSGDIKEASLERHLAQARAALALLDPAKPKTLVGSSRGGHLAARLSVEPGVEKLVLFCPAAYAAEAEGLRYGDEAFTARLRTEGSYRSSLVWADLQKFKGEALLVIGASDDVIPPAVVDLYVDALQGARLEVVRIPDAPHGLHAWFETHADWRDKVVRKIVELVA